MPSSGGILGAFDFQARACDLLGSPLTAFLLRGIMADYEAGGVSRDVLAGWEGRRQWETVLSLRLAAALHFLVLTGRAPGLAAYYPSAGGAFREDGFMAQVEGVMAGNRRFFDTFMRNTPQTNEVGRTGALIGGFLTVAAEAGLPLRCLEVGASAGLNLRWDRFHYDFGGATWGDASSPVQIGTTWTGNGPDTAVPLSVAERAGCDISPIDLAAPEAAARLKSYVWPDQLKRFQTLESALELADRYPLLVETADAGDWTARQLAEPRPGLAAVVYHSIAAQYFSTDTLAVFEDAMARAGERATRTAPVAWLRMEQPDPSTPTSIRLTMWPGGEDRLLANTHPHGTFVQWKEPP